MYDLKKISSELIKEYKINEEIIYIKDNIKKIGKIVKKKDSIEPYFIININNEVFETSIDNIFLKNNPLLNLSIKQIRYMMI